MLNVLIFILVAPVVLISAFFSESKDAQLDVDNNPFMNALEKPLLWNTLVFISIIAASFLKSLLEKLADQITPL